MKNNKKNIIIFSISILVLSISLILTFIFLFVNSNLKTELYIPKDISKESLLVNEDELIKRIKTTSVGIISKTSLNNNLYSKGSGVIYNMKKNNSNVTFYVITNDHVVSGGNKFKVTFFDSFTLSYDADLLGTAIHNKIDIAVLRVTVPLVEISNKDINYIDIFNYDTLNQVGQNVYSVGWPGGVPEINHISKGNISLLKDNTIYHDGPINSGNSGGGLYDTKGRLIGINVSKIISSGGYEVNGINQSIPLNIVKKGLLYIKNNCKDSNVYKDTNQNNNYSIENSITNSYNKIVKSTVALVEEVDRGGLLIKSSGGIVDIKDEKNSYINARSYNLSLYILTSTRSNQSTKIDRVYLSSYFYLKNPMIIKTVEQTLFGKKDPKFVLSILKINVSKKILELEKKEKMTLSSDKIKIGQDILMVSTPINISLFNYLNVGNISGIIDNEIFHDLENNNGSNGGFIFDINGNFVGINAFKFIIVESLGEEIDFISIMYDINKLNSIL